LAELNAIAFWNPDSNLDLAPGFDDAIMTEGRVAEILEPYIEAGFIAQNGQKPTIAEVKRVAAAQANTLGQVYGRGISGGTGGTPLMYAFTREDIQEISKTESIAEISDAAVSEFANPAHTKAGFWENAFGGLSNPTALVNRLSDVSGIAASDVAKWLNSEMTAFEAKHKGMAKLARSMVGELSAAGEALNGLGDELLGSVTNNPQLTAKGKALLDDAGLNEKDAADMLNSAAELASQAFHLIGAPPQEQFEGVAGAIVEGFQLAGIDLNALLGDQISNVAAKQNQNPLLSSKTDNTDDLAIDLLEDVNPVKILQLIAAPERLPANPKLKQRFDIRIDIGNVTGTFNLGALTFNERFSPQAHASVKSNDKGGIDLQLRVKTLDIIEIDSPAIGGITPIAKGGFRYGSGHDLIIDYISDKDGKVLDVQVNYGTHTFVGLGGNINFTELLKRGALTTLEPLVESYIYPIGEFLESEGALFAGDSFNGLFNTVDEAGAEIELALMRAEQAEGIAAGGGIEGGVIGEGAAAEGAATEGATGASTSGAGASGAGDFQMVELGPDGMFLGGVPVETPMATTSLVPEIQPARTDQASQVMAALLGKDEEELTPEELADVARIQARGEGNIQALFPEFFLATQFVPGGSVDPVLSIGATATYNFGQLVKDGYAGFIPAVLAVEAYVASQAAGAAAVSTAFTDTEEFAIFEAHAAATAGAAVADAVLANAIPFLRDYTKYSFDGAFMVRAQTGRPFSIPIVTDGAETFKLNGPRFETAFTLGFPSLVVHEGKNASKLLPIFDGG
jgi:hypothetical protein